MRLTRISNPKSKQFSQMWRLYTHAFPSHEQRPLHQQAGLLRNSQYSFIRVTEANRLVGLLGLWQLPGFAFIEHMAIQKSQRNKGIGSRLLQQVLRKNQCVVLEV